MSDRFESVLREQGNLPADAAREIARAIGGLSADLARLESRVLTIEASAAGGQAADAAAITQLQDLVPRVLWNTHPDVGAGGTTSPIGFQLVDAAGNALALQTTVRVFTSATIQGLAVLANKTINTATAGTIVSGGGTNDLVVETSAAGAFAATLTTDADATVYLHAESRPAGVPVNTDVPGVVIFN